MTPELCACGKPLHYLNPDSQRVVERWVAEIGLTIKVSYQGRAWLIPRHYIALHGLVAAELPALATQYGFEEVK